MKSRGIKVLIMAGIFFVATIAGYNIGHYFGDQYVSRVCYQEPSYTNMLGERYDTTPTTGCVGTSKATMGKAAFIYGSILVTNIILFGGSFLIKKSRRRI